MTASSPSLNWRPWTRYLRTTAWQRAWSAVSGRSTMRSWLCRLEIIFSFNIQQREASSITTPAHTPRKHTTLWFNVLLVRIDNYCVQMKECLECDSFFMWKTADPRHHFNQGWRGHWWRHARCRLVIHIASMQANDLDQLRIYFYLL